MDRFDAITLPALPRPQPLWKWTVLLVGFGIGFALYDGMMILAWIDNFYLWLLPFLAFNLTAYVAGACLIQLRRDYLKRVAWEEAEEQDAYCRPIEYDEPDTPAEASVQDMAFTPQLALQEQIRAYLLTYPEHERYLEEIVAWERQHPPQRPMDGWDWFETHTPQRIATMLVGAGILDVVYDSRSSRQYRLVGLPDTEEAMANLRIVPQHDSAPDLASLFRFVVGHDRAKSILRAAMEADHPVHVLLTGPPGTAKTLLLSDVGGLDGAEFYAGSTTTKAGLVALLLSKRPRYLVIDEIDKMATEDMTPLLNLMEGGVVTRLQAKVQNREVMDTRVFAGANDVTRLSAPIRSRFAEIAIPPYSPAEFVQVAQAVLVQREGIGPQVAMLIATAVVAHTTDIRDAVRVARLARGRAVNVEPTVAALFAERPLGSVQLPLVERRDLPRAR